MLAATPKSVKAAYDLANEIYRPGRSDSTKKELSSSVVQPTAHPKRLPRHRKQ
ncbi:phage tail protein [Escherichia coli]|nr:phage tail protein [Escherichia coli]